MTTPPSHPESAAERPLALRRRPDLTIEPQEFGRETYWLVTDPLTLNYYHLCAEEHAILEMLDGRISMGELKRRFERAFAPLQVTFDQLQMFLGRLHETGLLLSESAGQGRRLHERDTTRRRRTWWATLSNVLAIRLPGVDPEPLLEWLYPVCRWLFSPWFLAACLVAIAAAVGLAAVQFHAIQTRLPEFQAFFSAAGAAWLVLALIFAKVLHEFGHALCCKHFGGQCHEIGVLLLVFTPCLYCDVSSAWSFPSKWNRVAVSAAGILVEVVLAAVATFLWWFSTPGLLNSLCLSTMFVCSVNTLIFNGNPLLRYDGYHVLADCLEVPNLYQQAQGLLHRAAAWLLLGIPWRADRSLPARRRGLLAVYGLASAAYRWLVVGGILWFCYRVLKPHGLEPLAQLLVLVVVAGIVVTPVLRLFMLLKGPARKLIHWGWSIAVWTLLMTAVITAATVPLPFHVTAPAVLQPRDAHPVYVVAAGRLAQATTPGAAVEQGQELARLVNLEIRKEIVELTGQRDQQRLELENLTLRRSEDPAIAAQIPTAEAALADLEQRLVERRRDERNLVLRAPVKGLVLPPPRVPPKHRDSRELRTWQGSPLDEGNLGCYLEPGTLVCSVGSPTPLEAFLVIEQGDVNFIRPGQRVRLKLGELPGDILAGTVAEVATADLKLIPRELAKMPDLPVRLDEQGGARPLTPSYQVRVTLDAHGSALLPGTCCRAKVVVEPQTLAQRLHRYVQRTFRLVL